MDMRAPFSKLKKKIKHRLTGRKSNPDKQGADKARLDPTGSPRGPGPHVVAGGSHDQEGDGSDVGGPEVHSTILPPQPDEPGRAPADEVENEEGSEAEIDGGEISQRNSRSFSNVEVVVGSRSSREGDGEERAGQIYRSPSTLSIPHGGKSDST